MLEIIPLLIPALAIVGALLPIAQIKMLRMALAIAALGAGQIYLAVAAFGLLLLVDTNWRPINRIPSRGWIAGAGFVIAIIATTAMGEVTPRTYSELTQLGLYLLLFFLLTSYISDGTDLMRLLKACFYGSVVVAALGVATVVLGLQSPPHIFVGRGANEGSVFLSLVGVVPASILFVRTRNPLYVIGALLMCYAQLLATSRGSLGVSVVALLVAAFFLLRNLGLRALVVMLGLGAVYRSVPLLFEIFQGQLNFSSRERLALIEHGWYLSQDRFWTGWGWGSTNLLAAQAPTTRLSYPHFHNGYVQLLVESGAVGWAIILSFFVFAIMQIWKAMVKIRRSSISALAVATSLAIMLAFLFDAMLFGADRAVQIVILLALNVRAIALAEEQITAPHF